MFREFRTNASLSLYQLSRPVFVYGCLAVEASGANKQLTRSLSHSDTPNELYLDTPRMCTSGQWSALPGHVGSLFQSSHLGRCYTQFFSLKLNLKMFLLFGPSTIVTLSQMS